MLNKIKIMIKLELKHKKEVAKLSKLEQKLLKMIENTGNESLTDKFLEWQQQRNICNSIYNEWLAETLKNIR